jgi:hypothetical protein
MLEQPIPKVAGSSADNPIVDNGQYAYDTKDSNKVDKKTQAAVLDAGLNVITGYMQADAIRGQADYEATISELNADLNLYQAGEQQGVDFSKIIRYGEQVDETTGKIRAQFAGLEQEGGAAQDLIAENTLQGKLNQLAMMNEAQTRIGAANFGYKLETLRAKQKRKIADQQAKQAITMGYINSAISIGKAAAGASGGGS